MINSSQIYQQLAHLGADPMARMVLDTNFAVADQVSMVDFWVKYYEALTLLDLLDWDEEDWDCDDFALFAWAFMRMAYRRTNKKEGRNPKMGINLGVFAFEKANGGKHMINFQPTPYGVLFSEPQPVNGKCGTPVPLTQTEANSCFAYAI